MIVKRLSLVVLTLVLFKSILAQNIFPATGNVGIGTSSPQQPLDVFGKIRTSTNQWEYTDIYLQAADVVETGYNDVWPDQNERAVMIKPRAYLDGWGAGGAGIQFFTYDVVGGTYPNYTGGYRRAMVIRRNGNVGIGTANPQTKLHVQGDNLGSNINDLVSMMTLQAKSINNSIINFYTYRHASGGDWLSASTRIQQRIDATDMAYIEFNPPGMPWGMSLGTANQSRLYVNNDGQVGIGTTKINDNTYRLFVEKGIRTRKVKVDIDTWADYVFKDNYKLPTLKEVEDYVKEHRHLPDVPSAKEVLENGLDLGENQAILLKKIEELTLYLIELNKEIAVQRQLINTLEEKLVAVKP